MLEQQKQVLQVLGEKLITEGTNQAAQRGTATLRSCTAHTSQQLYE